MRVWTTVFFCLFAACIGVQLLYAAYFFVRVYDLPLKKVGMPTQAKPVSVVICAKNEAENLKKHLPKILNQKWQNQPADYEVVVVNDASSDDTAAVLAMLQAQYGEKLKVVTISATEKRNVPGKKFALMQGVAAAKHEYLLFTDADCEPASQYWLYEMAMPLMNGKTISAGYGQYNTASGLLNKFIRWETVHTFVQYSTYALAGKPYMAVGRNLATTKVAFQQAQQSDAWVALPSGDDDLLMRAAANNKNTAIVADAHAFTQSDAHTSWKAWAKQKQRHLSTGKYYKDDIQFLLAVYGMSHAGMWLLFVVLMCSGMWYMVAGLMLLRCVTYWAMWDKACTTLCERGLWWGFPLYDFGWMIYNFVFAPYIIWKNKQQWK